MKHYYNILTVILLSVLLSHRTIAKPQNKSMMSTNTITFHYVNPCNDIIDDVDLLKLGFISKTLEDFLSMQCESTYSRFTQAITDILRCRPSSQSTTTNSSEQLGTSATNFLINSYFPGSVKRQEAVDYTYAKGNKNIMFQETSRQYLDLVSESSNNHPIDSQKRAYQFPSILWLAIRIQSELLSQTALLDAINVSCRIGEVATKELAELLGMKELALFSPNHTKINYIKRGSHHASIIFGFTVQGDLTPSTELPHSFDPCNAAQIIKNNDSNLGLVSIIIILILIIISLIALLTLINYKITLDTSVKSRSLLRKVYNL